MKKSVIIILTMAITALFAVAQDFGRENGLGIRLTGDITFNQGKDDAVFTSFYRQVIGTKLGEFFQQEGELWLTLFVILRFGCFYNKVSGSRLSFSISLK